MAQTHYVDAINMKKLYLRATLYNKALDHPLANEKYVKIIIEHTYVNANLNG